jgi:hypothetical protein
VEFSANLNSAEELTGEVKISHVAQFWFIEDATGIIECRLAVFSGDENTGKIEN